ncbi:MAG: flagellar protein export ATPase FliI [Gammaproteobacteria bacterium]|nr:flagellar protein export ATPase FliI [Gammaproteobacteria bacterium]
MNQTEMVTSVDDRGTRWSNHLGQLRAKVHEPGVIVEGKLCRAAGLTLEATGCEAAVGARCLIEGSDGVQVEAEVVGFANNRLYLMPTTNLSGIKPNARVIPTNAVAQVPVGETLLGRVIDGAGNPLDGRGPLHCESRVSLTVDSINPLARQPISEPLDVGVRTINSLCTVGRGQRIGLFAGSGVGKSSLLAMMTRFTKADVTVVGLIGERGREVKEFVEDNLGPDGLSRSVVVTTPADCSPLMRIHGAWLATSIAEYFRDQGKSVLLLMDSLTRFAQAQREIGLAIGEPPATKGYPPSVFAKLPQLVERAGTGLSGKGSITAFYTVLAEGDDENDPIVDAARAILDGHIMLSRTIAESGIYPPIDVESSVSRSMLRVTSQHHQQVARRLRETYSYYVRHRDLMTVGAYQPGADPQLDRAVALWPAIQEFLSQSMHESVSLEQSIMQLDDMLNKTELPQANDEIPTDSQALPA